MVVATAVAMTEFGLLVVMTVVSVAVVVAEIDGGESSGVINGAGWSGGFGENIGNSRGVGGGGGGVGGEGSGVWHIGNSRSGGVCGCNFA